MPWIKIPAENHELFRAALPADPRIQTVKMFGGLAAKANGHMFGGTFARSVMLMLSETDRATALALDGAAPFDPMGNRSYVSDKVQMPEALMDEADELKAWVRRAFDYAVMQPTKKNKKAPAAKKPAPANKPVAKAKPKTTAAKKTVKPKRR